ncbi:MAG: hypothetical protein AAF203_10580 [Pseudomonadota bacterium]
MEIENIQKALDKVACPACETGKLSAVLRCDLDPSECVAKAVCNNCMNSFHLNQKGANATIAVCDINGMQCVLVPDQEKSA